MGGAHSEAGVSLVEVMLVLAIIGIVGGAAVLGLGNLGRPGAEAEARRLADRLQLAADRALVTGAPWALEWQPTGYRFSLWEEAAGAWVAATDQRLAEPRALPEGLGLSGPEDGGPVVIAADRVSTASFGISEAGLRWTVTFDGLLARAVPGDGRG